MRPHRRPRPCCRPSKVDSLIRRHLVLSRELNLSQETAEAFFQNIKDKVMSECPRDELLAQGELMSSFLLSQYLELNLKSAVQLIDARVFLKTDSCFGEAKPNENLIGERCQELLKKETLMVTQGFIGSTIDGKTTVLGREGSDYSATLFARALKASEVHIWTDVSGIYSCDPRLVKDAFPFKKLSYSQASMLAENGAKVLFSKTLSPLMKDKIPLWVKSSYSPDEEGTLINSDESSEVGCTLQGDTIAIVGPHEFQENCKVIKQERDLTIFKSDNPRKDIVLIHDQYVLKRS